MLAPSELRRCRWRAYASAYAWPVRRMPGGVAVQSLVASWLRLLGRPAPPGRAPSELWQCRRRAYASAYAWPVRREPLGELGRPKLVPVASVQ